jgi:hypothetical protein
VQKPLCRKDPVQIQGLIPVRACASPSKLKLLLDGSIANKFTIDTFNLPLRNWENKAFFQ